MELGRGHGGGIAESDFSAVAATIVVEFGGYVIGRQKSSIFQELEATLAGGLRGLFGHELSLPVSKAGGEKK